MNRNGYGYVDNRRPVQWERTNLYGCQNCPNRGRGGACCKSCSRGGPCEGGGSGTPKIRPQPAQYYGQRPVAYGYPLGGGASAATVGGGGSAMGYVMCMIVFGIIVAALVTVAIAVPSILLWPSGSSSSNDTSSDTATSATTVASAVDATASTAANSTA